MIDVEYDLKMLFDTLPDLTIDDESYKPMFDFGNHEDLLKYLEQKDREEGETYPLIWLETPITLTGSEDKKSFDLKLVLATQTSAEISNVERLEITFKPTLIPLYKNILKALNQSGFTQIIKKEQNKTTNYYNYGVRQIGKKREEQAAIDIWDAIKFECKLEVTDACDCDLKINY